MLNFLRRVVVVGVLLLLVMPTGILWGSETEMTEESFAADELTAAGGVENLKRALDQCKAVADKTPDNYEANWKCARAHYN